VLEILTVINGRFLSSWSVTFPERLSWASADKTEKNAKRKKRNFNI